MRVMCVAEADWVGVFGIDVGIFYGIIVSMGMLGAVFEYRRCEKVRNYQDRVVWNRKYSGRFEVWGLVRIPSRAVFLVGVNAEQ